MGSIFLCIGSIFITVCAVSKFTLASRFQLCVGSHLPLAITSNSSMVDQPTRRALFMSSDCILEE
jgi:hypothetical protein